MTAGELDDALEPTDDYVNGPNWRLRRPAPSPGRGVVCVPTVHPQGDQRVLRCAQSLLDVGFHLHLIWMGGKPGTDRWAPGLKETRLAEARSTRDRLRALPRLAGIAWRERPAAWHIHDFYMLPLALAWNLLTGRPVIYDVHEFYGQLYAMKMPKNLRRIAGSLIDRFQGWAAHRLGGVNLVTEAMRDPFEGRTDVSISVTPNFPSGVLFADRQGNESEDRCLRVVHTGSLSPSYGSEVLIEVARLLAKRKNPTQIIAVARFHSVRARHDFFRTLERAGAPINLVLIDPMPAHKIPTLLGSCGIGLSLIQDHGQNPKTVPTKLFEYTLAGVAVVASDLDAQTSFIREHSVGQVVDAADAGAYVQAIEDLQSRWHEVESRSRLAANWAQTALTWESSCAPRLQELALRLIA